MSQSDATFRNWQTITGLRPKCNYQLLAINFQSHKSREQAPASLPNALASLTLRQCAPH
jgi:hypothetical protein